MTYKAKYMLGYLLYSSMISQLELAVSMRDFDNIKTFEELVDYYADTFHNKSEELMDKLLKLKELQGVMQHG